MRRISVRAIVVHEGKLLLAKMTTYKYSKYSDFYSTVGGTLDDGEAVLDGLRREIVEETGVEPKVGRLLAVHQYMDSSENLEFFFHIENAVDFLNIDLDKTTHGREELKEIGFYNPQDIVVKPDFLKNFNLEEALGNPEVKIYSFLKEK